MITIAVDAMGGDHAPRPEVEGSVLAAREYGVRIMLVGQANARGTGQACGSQLAD
jgi:glycerol-3-phosphate acyltransferase PlsX